MTYCLRRLHYSKFHRPLRCRSPRLGLHLNRIHRKIAKVEEERT